jgi:hypothetical protein
MEKDLGAKKIADLMFMSTKGFIQANKSYRIILGLASVTVLSFCKVYLYTPILYKISYMVQNV